MEIFQYSPTGLRALENADHKNAIMFRPPKSHTVSNRLLIILVIVTFFAFQVVRFSFARSGPAGFFLLKGRGTHAGAQRITDKIRRRRPSPSHLTTELSAEASVVKARPSATADESRVRLCYGVVVFAGFRSRVDYAAAVSPTRRLMPMTRKMRSRFSK